LMEQLLLEGGYRQMVPGVKFKCEEATKAEKYRGFY